MDQRTMIFPRSYDKLYVEHNIIVLISYQPYSFQLNWIKGKDTRGYPYHGYLPTARPAHNIGNSHPPCPIIILYYDDDDDDDDDDDN